MKVDPTWPSIAQRRARKVKVLSRYKFYLAFENAPVEDYVSEKVLHLPSLPCLLLFKRLCTTFEGI